MNSVLNTNSLLKNKSKSIGSTERAAEPDSGSVFMLGRLANQLLSEGSKGSTFPASCMKEVQREPERRQEAANAVPVATGESLRDVS